MQDKIDRPKLLISIVIFFVSGFLSSWLYYQFQNQGGFLFPGLLFTGATILIFLLTNTRFEGRGLLLYYLLMNLVYLAIWFVTLVSAWFAPLVGIMTSGVGALLTFLLVDKFIVGIRFNNWSILMIGGLTFLVTDILYFVFSSVYDKTPMEYLFMVDLAPENLFIEVFIFWHLMVGIKLFLTLYKNAYTRS